MTSASISPLEPYAAAWKATSQSVETGAKVYGEALAKVFDSYGLNEQAQYARTQLPFYVAGSVNEALSWGTFLVLAGGNPLLATAMKSFELTGRALALGIVPRPFG